MPDIRVKICGLRTQADVAAVAKSGAAYAGFVFFPKSPRHLTIPEAKALALSVPVGLAKVALIVNADDVAIEAILSEVPIDILQLHGAETPDRVAQIRDMFGLPVMKAVGLSGEADLAAIMEYALVADQLLVDAKPGSGTELPGGNGLAFDWRLLVGRKWLRPWMLAGGLTSQNVAEAIRLTGARQVDVSSGVDSAPGVKDHAKIAAFVAATG